VFRGQKSYAGVAVITREAMQNISFGIDDGEEPDEPRLIRGTVAGMHLVNTYVPQGRSPDSEHFQYKLRWFERLRNFFERHYTPDDTLLWAGDFNVAPLEIDVHNPKRLVNHVDFHPEARAALERVRKWGFVDVFRQFHPDEAGQYSYYDYRVRGAVERGLGWRVDHIWTTEGLAQKAVKSWIDVEARLGERPSDHTFLVAEFVL
jgi:exodeoxyribonuclease-3